MQGDNVITQQHQSPTLAIPESHFFNSIAHSLTLEAQFFRQQLAEAYHINAKLLQFSSAFSVVPRVKSEEKYEQVILSPEAQQSSPLVKQEEEEQNPETQGNCFNQPFKRKGTESRPSSDKNDKNETKNIPKNYGKAMLSFIQKNATKFKDNLIPILRKEGLSVNDLLKEVKKHKKQVNSINYLKLIWGHQNLEDPIFKCIRSLSYLFMRKHCLEYIFNSRVKNHSNHIKYLKRIMEGIQNSEDFTSIKQF